jgi:hypothetical protein
MYKGYTSHKWAVYDGLGGPGLGGCPCARVPLQLVVLSHTTWIKTTYVTYTRAYIHVHIRRVSERHTVHGLKEDGGEELP